MGRKESDPFASLLVRRIYVVLVFNDLTMTNICAFLFRKRKNETVLSNLNFMIRHNLITKLGGLHTPKGFPRSSRDVYYRAKLMPFFDFLDKNHGSPLLNAAEKSVIEYIVKSSRDRRAKFPSAFSSISMNPFDFMLEFFMKSIELLPFKHGPKFSNFLVSYPDFPNVTPENIRDCFLKLKGVAEIVRVNYNDKDFFVRNALGQKIRLKDRSFLIPWTPPRRPVARRKKPSRR